MLKKLGLVFLFLLLLVGAGALAVHFFLPEEKVREIVVREARKATGREVTLGQIRVGLVFGLRLRDVEVKGLASAREVTVRPSWRALLRREVDIQSVFIDELRLKVPESAVAPPPRPASKNETVSQPKPKSESAPSSAQAPAVAAGETPKPLPIPPVRRITLEDAEIEAMGHKITDLDAKVTGIDEDSFDLDASFETQKRLIEIKGTLFYLDKKADADVKILGLLEGHVKGGADAVEFDVKTDPLSKERLAELGASSPVDLPAMRLRGKTKGQAFEALRVDSKWGTLEGAGDLKKAQAKVALALPPLLGWPAVKLDGGLAVDGDDVTVKKMTVGTPWGPVKLDALLRGARKGELKPEYDAELDVNIPDEAVLPHLPPGVDLPALRASGKVKGTLEKASFDDLRLHLGKTDLELEGTASMTAVDVLVKCRAFVLEELVKIHPATRGLKVTGKGLFAISARGPLDKPLLAGKAQFANVSYEPLANVTGVATFDERRIDVPDLKGLLFGSPIDVDLSVTDYWKYPFIEVDAVLDRVDLGKLLAEKAAKAAEGAAPVTAAVKDTDEPAKPLRSKGRLKIKDILHPNADFTNTVVRWDLTGITPDFKQLSGEADLNVDEGQLRDLRELVKNPVAKIVLIPVLILQKLSKLKIVPNLRQLNVHELTGDYAFVKGMMSVVQSRMDADDLYAEMTGTVYLPTDALDLTSKVKAGILPATEYAITGTTADPKAKLKVGKMLAEPAKKLIDGLLKRR